MMGKRTGLFIVALAIWAGGLLVPVSWLHSAATPPRQTAAAVIVLPQKLVAGQRATLAVLDSAGHLASGVEVEFTGGERVTTDATGRAAFTAPAESGVLRAQLTPSGASASTTILAPPPNLPDGVQVLDCPRVLLVSDRFAVDGSGFRGDADNNRARLGDQPALVLAASPVSLVLLPGPRAAPGPTQLLVEVDGRSAGPVPVMLVSLELTGPGKPLAAGEKGELTVRVRGTDQRLVLEAHNLAPEVVELPRGNVQRVTSSGGTSNLARIELQGVRAGDFSVSIRLVPGAAGLPDMEAARHHLLAARSLAPPPWQKRLDRVIRRIERDPQSLSKIRDELEKMLAERPEGEFGRLVEAAWRELVKR